MTVELNVLYGVATISRLLKMIGLFCKRALQKRLYSARETYDFEEPTDRSHSISIYKQYLIYALTVELMFFFLNMIQLILTSNADDYFLIKLLLRTTVCL